jgi:hypothetical protein
MTTKDVRFDGMGVGGGMKFSTGSGDGHIFEVLGCAADPIQKIVAYSITRYQERLRDIDTSDADEIASCAFGFNDAMSGSVFHPRSRTEGNDFLHVRYAHAYFVGYAQGTQCLEVRARARGDQHENT